MFRFTIRDVLWLMVVVGMGVGWFLSYTRLDEENTRLLLRDHDQRADLEYMEYWLLDSKNSDSDAFNHLKEWATKRRKLGLAP
jgi:hypothetical protein